MDTKTITAIIVAGVVIVGALALLPDFLRYVRIRSM